VPDPARGLTTTRPDNEVVQGKKREVTSVFCARAGFLEPARTKNNTIIDRRILRRPNRGSPTSALRTPVVRKRSRPPPLAR